ncbi:MAG: TlpA family protein disulfide reductase [Candidatus Kapaibacterium sp.]
MSIKIFFAIIFAAVLSFACSKNEAVNQPADKNTGHEVGDMAPNFTINTAQNGEFVLNANKGRVILLDFWASWCGPCRSSTPQMIDLYEDYSDKGLVMIGLSFDYEEGTWTDYIEKNSMKWLQAWDHRRDIRDLFAIPGTPYTVIIDKEGKIVYNNLRSDFYLRQELDKLLN